MNSACRPHFHAKARCESYPRYPDVVKYPVPDDKVTWDIMFEEYEPVDFTAPSVAKGPVWADPDIKNEPSGFGHVPKWNEVDGDVDRRSHTGRYNLWNGLPRNIVGRTGVCARGLLGRWGPNHAADPIVTRWKRDEVGHRIKHPLTNKPILQFIAIMRGDSGEWAIPGGMVGPGEDVSETLKREFSEETMNSLEMTSSQVLDMKRKVKDTFKSGYEIYRGYVDDPRNTDNAWMETVAVNFHDGKGESVSKFNLHAGDDAIGVKWTDLHSDIQLYASHVEFCEKVAARHNAHWESPCLAPEPSPIKITPEPPAEPVAEGTPDITEPPAS